MKLTAILPTHNPSPVRLKRALEGLRLQTLSTECWETLLVDNASNSLPSDREFAEWGPPNLRIIREERLGLTRARRRGFSEASGSIVVLVDDDNVLDANYLGIVLDFFAAQPRVGLAGGRVLPEFEREPETWTREFHPLLALRDLGDQPLLSNGFREPGADHNTYPPFAPIGAGMALRAEVAREWLQALDKDQARIDLDRRGDSLLSGGDNDIVMTGMEAGWEVAYVPALSLVHLIPASRLDPEYLARINFSIQKSWMKVLFMHDANPWAQLSRIGCELRRFKAWMKLRPWTSPAARIRFAGTCGHFEGRIVAR